MPRRSEMPKPSKKSTPKRGYNPPAPRPSLPDMKVPEGGMLVEDFTLGHKLGTLWIHKPTNTEHRLRRTVDSKTLHGLRGFWSQDTLSFQYHIKPDEWEPK